MKATFVLILATVHSSLGAGLISIPFLPKFYQSVTNPNACLFNGPQDIRTLRGENFIENFGAGKCLTLKKNGPKNMPIELERCTWNRLPTSNQLYNFRNGNGGTILKPTVSGVFGKETCVSTTSFGNRLAGEECSFTGKDFSQTWRFNQVRANQYQMIQISSGKCLKADTTRNGIYSYLEKCNSWDNFQLWRICTSK